MRRIFLPSMIFILVLSLVVVSGAVAQLKGVAKRVGDIENSKAIPKKDLILYDGYTSKMPCDAEEEYFIIGQSSLCFNALCYVQAPDYRLPLIATYILILKRIEPRPRYKILTIDFEIDKRGKWCLSPYFEVCPPWPGQWEMIPIVKSSTEDHIPYNPAARYMFMIDWPK